jgi:hypothetical protein
MDSDDPRPFADAVAALDLSVVWRWYATLRPRCAANLTEVDPYTGEGFTDDEIERYARAELADALDEAELRRPATGWSLIDLMRAEQARINEARAWIAQAPEEDVPLYVREAGWLFEEAW